MSELKTCPFCGIRDEIPANHEPGCFMRMYAESVDAICNGEPMPHSSESIRAAWNTRYERPCEMELQSCVDAEGNVFSFVCSECGVDAYGHVDIGYCPNCGAKVVEP